jgi:predicted transcriptional regulator
MEKRIQLLTAIGFPPAQAKALDFVLDQYEQPFTQRDVDRGADIPQPAVSLALADFMNRKWIKSNETITHEKGRPHKEYLLAISKTLLYKDISRQVRGEIGSLEKALDELKEVL